MDWWSGSKGRDRGQMDGGRYSPRRPEALSELSPLIETKFWYSGLRVRLFLVNLGCYTSSIRTDTLPTTRQGYGLLSVTATTPLRDTGQSVCHPTTHTESLLDGVCVPSGVVSRHTQDPGRTHSWRRLRPSETDPRHQTHPWDRSDSVRVPEKGR